MCSERKSKSADQHVSLWYVAILAVTFDHACSLARIAGAAELLHQEQVAQISEWFTAWELVSKDVYGVDYLRPVEFVFFDSKFVYTTSDVTGENGIDFDGPHLLDQDLRWRFSEHDGSLLLPDGSTVPIGLMSFAAPTNADSNGAFFVMPLPGFWEAADVTSDELGLDNLLTGVFLHEFSHSQQMHSFGAQMSEFERAHQLGNSLTDDIVQHNFEQNEEYTSYFRDEVRLFYDAAHSDSNEGRLALARLAMDRYKTRQQRYFNGKLAMLRELDDFFLSMEGFGQFTMYSWLIHPSGGALERDVAEAGVRRGGRWWSQEQGLALFLLVQQFSNPEDWADRMLGVDYELVTDLLDAEIAGN